MSGEATHDDRRQKSSPLVRRIARENKVDVAQITGSGLGGRVTKRDILEYLGSGIGSRGNGDPQSPRESSARVEIQPLSAMRKKIAEHMVLSQRTSAHVHSVFHVNFSDVERIRQAKKEQYERLGAKLSYMAFIARAVIAALRRHPVVNASLDGDSIVYKKDVNLGIAVALESGLLVPVIKNADEKDLLGLSRAVADVAERARAKQLKPEEVQGGTFTITNPGQFGAQFGMPIISQPQVAILGVGTIEKRPVVVDAGIAIQTMAYLTLGYDHRLIDGAVADQFMSRREEAPRALRPEPGLAARGESPSAFDERRILAACVVPPSNTGRILSRRALSSRRLVRLGATPDFHHGLLVRPLAIRRLGVVRYQDALVLQRALVEERRAGRAPDLLLLIQHPPVITLGVKGDGGRSNIVASAARLGELGVDICETGRGGDVTFHGPDRWSAIPSSI